MKLSKIVTVAVITGGFVLGQTGVLLADGKDQKSKTSGTYTVSKGSGSSSSSGKSGSSSSGSSKGSSGKSGSSSSGSSGSRIHFNEGKAMQDAKGAKKDADATYDGRKPH